MKMHRSITYLVVMSDVETGESINLLGLGFLFVYLMCR